MTDEQVPAEQMEHNCKCGKVFHYTKKDVLEFVITYFSWADKQKHLGYGMICPGCAAEVATTIEGVHLPGVQIPYS